MRSDKTYQTNPLKFLDQLRSDDGTSDGFCRPKASLYSQFETFLKAGQMVAVKSMGSEAVDGVDCQKVIVDIKYNRPHDLDCKATNYFGPDNLLHWTRAVVTSKQINYTMDTRVTSLKADEPVADATVVFTYTPPPGITAYGEPPPQALLANGVAAPDFTSVDNTRATVKLSDFRGKVVVLDFWASWCGLCKASMPHNLQVTKKLQAANVPMVLLAVDNSEDQPAFAKWVQEHPQLS